MNTATLAACRQTLRVLWAAALCVVVAGSLMPSGSAPLEMLGRLHLNDKILHFSGYAVLAFVPALHERWRTVALASIALTALGVLLEFAQIHVEGRTFELADMAANTAGVVSGVVAAVPFRGFLSGRC